MTYETNTPRLQALIAKLAPPGKKSDVLAALKAAQAPPPPPGAPPPPTSPDGPFGLRAGSADSDATARFIIECNERRLGKVPPPAPTDPTAAFIVATVAKLKARV